METEFKILYIEDDPDDIYIFADVLEKSALNRYDLVTFNNGSDALEYLKAIDSEKELPDVIILDINMPKMDGLETLGKIQKERMLKEIPSFILTTTNNPEFKLQSRLLGCKGYYPKPARFKDFEKIIDEILNAVK